MGEDIPTEVEEKLKELLGRMGLKLNEQKTRKVDSRKEGFDFLGYSVRYDKDLYGRPVRYWNIVPSKKAEARIREKVRLFLRTHGHSKPEDVAEGINKFLTGWLNYQVIAQVSYPKASFRKLRYYLMTKIDRYYRRKSQRKCKRLHGMAAFNKLVEQYGLIDPAAWSSPQVRISR